MPKEKSSFHVLNDLRELAKEAERLEEQIPQISILEEYFSLVRDTALKIKSCTSIKNLENIEFPPDIKTVIGKKCAVKNVDADITESQRAHLHAEKHVHASEVAADIKADKNEVDADMKADKKERSPKITVKKTSIYTPENREYEQKSSSALLSKTNQKSQLLPALKSLPEKKILNSSVIKIISENSVGSSQRLLETPVMNQTFNKSANNTVILDSASANKTVEKLKIGDEIRLTRSASKQKLEHSKDSSPPISTESGSKRKSTTSKSRSAKKPKTENVAISATKSAKSKQPLIKKNSSRPESVILLNKMKPVIVPTMKQNTSLASSKEKQIMEEIQKKEEKANKNRKKVLAERQLKVEENKKKRTEKMEKTLQKRLQMEKEKEDRLEKKDVEKKTQIDASKESVKLAKPATKTTKTKALIDQHMKENKSVINMLALKQNETKADSLHKTPIRKSHDSETYDLTPAPDSSTYDFSDDEDKHHEGKHIPLWAQGIHLKLALNYQFHKPPNTDELFGSYIEPPNLTDIFGVHKKTYSKRTSSAVWHSPPDLDLSFHR